MPDRAYSSARPLSNHATFLFQEVVVNYHHYASHHSPFSKVVLVVLLCATLLASALGQPAPATAQALTPFSVVKDFGDTVYPGSSLFSGGASSFRGATVAGSIAYFRAYMPDSGEGLWRSDGTEAGTFVLRDLCPGDGYQSSQPEFAVLGTTVYFVASDCVLGDELWKSDGTPTGTQRVKDINPGPYSSDPENLF